MRTSTMLLLLFGVVIIFPYFVGCSAYNTFVAQEEGINEAWAQVEDAYKRRADLIPNLVEIVKGAAGFEKQTLESVIEARSKATQVNVDLSKVDFTQMTTEQLGSFADAQSSVTGTLGRLLAVVEDYPELRATDAFRDLQAQLEGTENRISKERRDFNQAVERYNKSIRQFPGVLFSRPLGFEKRPYFEAEGGVENAPTIEL